MDPILRLRNDLFREFYYFFCEFYASRFNKTARTVLEGFTLFAVSKRFSQLYSNTLTHLFHHSGLTDGISMGIQPFCVCKRS